MDPAMRPFREKFLSRWNEEILKPLEQEMGAPLAKYWDLLQGQVTVALVPIAASSSKAGEPVTAWVLIADARDKRSQLTAALGEMQKKWIASGKALQREKLRGHEFMIVPLGTNDLPAALKSFFPEKLESHELGEEKQPTPPPLEIVVGQVHSALLLASSIRALEKTTALLAGAPVPSLSEQAGFESARQEMFREAPLYAWVNAKALLADLARATEGEKENPLAPSPVELPRLDQFLAASGLSGLHTIAWAWTSQRDGCLSQLRFAVPEASRAGVFKIFAGCSKETSPPPFVPFDTLDFGRWRIDGPSAWATLEKMMTELFPQSLSTLNFLIDTANEAAGAKDRGFDVRKNLIGNLGDDWVRYRKTPRNGESGDGPGSPGSLFLVGSPNPDVLAASLKNILVFMSAQAGAPSEREFLGRTVYSVPMPTLPVPVPGVSKTPEAQTLHYAASGGYVGLSRDVALLEEFLRSAENQGRELRDAPGLAEAMQRIGGPGTSWFSYENSSEQVRTAFAGLQRGPQTGGGPIRLSDLLGAPDIPGLNVIFAVLHLSPAEKKLEQLMEYSLLPSFDKVCHYFGFTVSTGAATPNGLIYRSFTPASKFSPGAPGPK
jgi:hypothetical protein